MDRFRAGRLAHAVCAAAGGRRRERLVALSSHFSLAATALPNRGY